MKNFLFIFSVCFLLLCALPVVSQTIYHVNINSGDDSNDGLKWSTAFKNLQVAIDLAEKGDEIWIAAGTYHPTKKIADVYGYGWNMTTPTGDRHRSFLIKKDIEIYGGFPAAASDATSMSSRNWKYNQTILSGDFNGDDGDNFENMTENAHHVIILFDASPAMVIDGLFITGGCADDISSTFVDGNVYYASGQNGGGIYAYSPGKNSSPTISNVSLYGNNTEESGGAIYNYSFEGDASPILSNVSIIHNKTRLGQGGGFFNDGRNVYAELKNVNVVGNESSRSGGGLSFNFLIKCDSRIINTVISGNFAKNGNGGGIYFSTLDEGSAEPKIINSTICGNRVGIRPDRDGGGFVVLSNGFSKTVITNTVIWGNSGNEVHNFYAEGKLGSANEITGSLIEGSDDGSGTNLHGSTGPNFLQPVSAYFAPTMEGDYQLALGSPLINSGINGMISLSEDLLGNTRVFGGTVDIGAYESQGTPPVDNGTLFSEKTIWSYSGNLYVRINNTATLRVYSFDGMLIKQENNLGMGTYEFPLPKGIYIVSLNNGVTEKIVIR